MADEDGRLIESNTAYDRKVVGVVSGGGDRRPGVVLGGSRRDGGRQAAVALVGRVACKVDASYAAVEVGDLLTTSPTSGHAMKAVDAGRAFGCILGKATPGIRDGRGRDSKKPLPAMKIGLIDTRESLTDEMMSLRTVLPFKLAAANR